MNNRLLIPTRSEPRAPFTAVEHLVAAYDLYGDVTPVATRSAMGATFNTTDQFNGAIALPNGRVLGIPDQSPTFLNIDTSDDSAVRETLGATLLNDGTKQYRGAVFYEELGAEGLVYVLPYEAQDIIVIDVATMTTVYQGTMGTTLPLPYRGGVIAANRKTYCCPESATDILVIDPFDTTGSDYGTAVRTSMGLTIPGGSAKWPCFTRAVNDKLYGVPNSHAQVLIVDPADTTASVHGTAFLSAMGGPASLSDLTKWQGSFLGADRCIYGVPFTATDICKIDPHDQSGSVHGTLTRVTMGLTPDGNNSKWQHCCNGPDGRGYAFPRGSQTILQIDPLGGTAVISAFGPALTGGSKWQSGAMALNGSIYGIPQDAVDILKISFPGVEPMDEDIVLGPFLNKL